MNYYCTLFDTYYLSKGLAMYESLARYSSEYKLFIFPFDEPAREILLKMDLENVEIIPLADFETQELLEIKKERTKAEYCWTCTPSIISYIIEKKGVSNCTYIDADLYFYSDPSVLIKEMIDENKSVLITEHRFSLLPRLHGQKRAGRFCVQFMTFKNQSDSLGVLEKWKNQCIEWCYARYEDGKFGDQKYLENWPSEYNNIHILENKGGGLAPWNIGQFQFLDNPGSITGIVRTNKERFTSVFYHFQYVKQIDSDRFDTGWYLIPRTAKTFFYLPYLKKLKEIEQYLRQNHNGYITRYVVFSAKGIKYIFKLFLKRVLGYNIMKII